MTDLAILNHGQVTRTTPELAPPSPNYHITPTRGPLRYKEAKDVSGHSDITVAIDGTWQKHGHTSLNGAVSARSFYTGKMLDASILSRFCKCPKKMHDENCNANHFGNGGSDGDARAYKAVIEMQPYGDTGIEKLECVAYVKKRMGTRLQSLKLKMKRKKLSDKKTLDDHGTLADAEIDSGIMDWLSGTIPIVLIKCTDSINSIKGAIWATYFHKAFMDAYRQHGLCPTNEDTWCEYNRAITTGEVYKHKNTFPSEVLNYMKYVCTGNYQQLSSLPNAYMVRHKTVTKV
ncbi:uncharacterized protein TNCV_3223881 [Trichonephila clavipes]|nr:uncharacterized protein TNCV_3223881 [Trichonephila clavipes]